MEDRLIHSSAAQRRSAEMSEVGINFYVEGTKIDIFFYSTLVKHSNLNNQKYRFKKAQDLPRTTGGKGTLISYFETLLTSNSLRTDYFGKITQHVFFLDKDIDDHLGIIMTNPRMIYTKYYDVESYCYICGNLATAISICANQDQDTIESEMGGLDLIEQAIKRWASWLAYCVTAKEYPGETLPNFSQSSKFNTNIYGDYNPEMIENHFDRLNTSNRLPSGFTERYEQNVEMINGLNADEVLKFFKGKWFGELIPHIILERFGSIVNDQNSLKGNGNLTRHLLQSIDFNHPDIVELIQKINRAIYSP